jgi:hypothetical protein
MPVDAHILDSAYGKLESFGPDLALPKDERLKKEFPRLGGGDEEEILRQVDLVSKTVWSLAERGGEAKMKKEEIVAELQAAHPFLRDGGLKQAIFLVNYYAWHEGYAR